MNTLAPAAAEGGTSAATNSVSKGLNATSLATENESPRFCDTFSKMLHAEDSTGHLPLEHEQSAKPSTGAHTEGSDDVSRPEESGTQRDFVPDPLLASVALVIPFPNQPVTTPTEGGSNSLSPVGPEAKGSDLASVGLEESIQCKNAADSPKMLAGRSTADQAEKEQLISLRRAKELGKSSLPGAANPAEETVVPQSKKNMDPNHLGKDGDFSIGAKTRASLKTSGSEQMQSSALGIEQSLSEDEVTKTAGAKAGAAEIAGVGDIQGIVGSRPELLPLAPKADVASEKNKDSKSDEIGQTSLRSDLEDPNLSDLKKTYKSSDPGFDSGKSEDASGKKLRSATKDEEPGGKGSGENSLPFRVSEFRSNQTDLSKPGPSNAPHSQEGASASSIGRSEQPVHQTQGHPAQPIISSADVDRTQLLQSLRTSELRVNLRSNEFGSVNIHGSLRSKEFVANIYVDNQPAATALSENLSVLESSLHQYHHLNSRLEVSVASQFTGDSSQRHPHQQPQQQRVMNLPLSESIPDREIGEQESTNSGLSIRA